MARLTPEEQESPEKFDLLHEALSAFANTRRLGMIRLAFAVRFLAVAGFGLQNREEWMDLAPREHADWAKGLTDSPLDNLATEEWRDSTITGVERLAGSIVQDHLNRPLQVSRFRQMMEVEI